MLWNYDEPSLTLTNAALDAEIKLESTALVNVPIDGLPPVRTSARVGAMTAEFIIRRRHILQLPERLGETDIHTIWWCVDFNAAKMRHHRIGKAIEPQLLDPTAWSAFSHAVEDCFRAFVRLKPPSGASEFLHVIGGRIGSEWISRSFRSHGFPGGYPKGGALLKLWERETLNPPSISADGWKFENGAAPRIIYMPTGEIIAHQKSDGQLHSIISSHWFHYEGRFGKHQLPISIRLLSLADGKPPVWEIDCRTAFEITAGASRDRNHPGRAGKARVSEAEWGPFTETLISGLLHWPACEATSVRPLWLKFDRHYQEGCWTPTPLVAGLNAAVTGLGS